MQFNKFGFTTRYTDFLTLVAHEYFHCFNVKRIRPDALGPFNYEAENYTKLLWVAEGGTAYYESVLVQRAGLISDREYLSGKADQFKALQDRPGRFETSLEEASFDAWIKYYRPDENAINNQISYYDKGEIVNFLLDLEIRNASKGAKSLDDVMRYLYNEYYKKGRNYTPEDYQKISEMMAGKSLDDFFKRYVRGHDELDYNSSLNSVGLQLSINKGREQGYLGANLTQQGERLNISSVSAGTPAYEQGLNANDQIIAVDGQRASLQFLNSYLGERKSGDKVILIIEDDPDIAESIRYNVERAGNYTAQVALTGEDGWNILRGRESLNPEPSLVILDLNLPGINGFELCRRVRNEERLKKLPIIMLTAMADENDKVRGLEAGADDYVTKPFSVRELIARMRAALRRAGYEEEEKSYYDDGHLKIDYSGFTVTCGGKEVKLTRKEFALLAILSRNQGRVVPRERLLDHVWGLEYYGEARTLDVHMSGLRRKLGNCGDRIETVIGIGYRFRGCNEISDAAQALRAAS